MDIDVDHDSSTDTTGEMSIRSRLVLRLAVGLLQGILIAFLINAADLKKWPATDQQLFIPICVVAAYWPLLLLVGANLRLTIGLLWAFASAVLIAALSHYSVWRVGSDDAWQSPQIIAALFPFLFIAHSLVAAADTDQKPIARYETYFDIAWKLGLQIMLSGAFVALFWVILWIGAALFDLIGIDFLRDLIDNRWFALPTTAVALACAVHVTDARVSLVRGMRTLILTLMSWILPVMVILAIAFVAALPFTGLQPLWATRSATALLLVASAALVFLINAAYRDGSLEENGRPFVIRVAAMAGSFVLIPIVAIACYALMLRIGQYGLTPDRVIGFFACGIGVCFAMGYAISALGIGGWLKAVEATNVFAAFLIVAVILALFSPLSDPARLSVQDQVTRLASGKITADDFDYDFLRFQSGRYGRETLARLAKQGVGKEPEKVASFAGEALKSRSASARAATTIKPTPAQLTANIAVTPAGAKLPDSFLTQDWSVPFHLPMPTPQCLTGNTKCHALLTDLDRDGAAEIVIIDFGQSAVFKAQPDGTWAPVGTLGQSLYCTGVVDALTAGTFSSSPSRFDDLVAGGMHVHIEEPCPPAD